MYYEKLALEVNAATAGMTVVKPPVQKGTSGVEHRYTMMAAYGASMYGVDIYPDVGEIEILRSFVKQLDTGTTTIIICLSGRPSMGAQDLARTYGIQILGPGEVEDLFSSKIVPLTKTQRQVGTAV